VQTAAQAFAFTEVIGFFDRTKAALYGAPQFAIQALEPFIKGAALGISFVSPQLHSAILPSV